MLNDGDMSSNSHGRWKPRKKKKVAMHFFGKMKNFYLKLQEH
jgi:hypothetical protein